jgi:hypothetical protein
MNYFDALFFSGTKSTFRIFNKKRMMTLGRNGFGPAEGEHWLFWNYAGIPFMGRTRSSINDKTFLFSPEIIR